MMPSIRTACRHPNGEAIAQALIIGIPLRTVADRPSVSKYPSQDLVALAPYAVAKGTVLRGISGLVRRRPGAGVTDVIHRGIELGTRWRARRAAPRPC
jgi:hypothetical protein